MLMSFPLFSIKIQMPGKWKKNGVPKMRNRQKKKREILGTRGAVNNETTTKKGPHQQTNKLGNAVGAIYANGVCK